MLYINVFLKEELSDWIASLVMTGAGTDRVLWSSPKMTKEKRCQSPKMTKEKRCHPELVSGSHYSIYPLVFVCKIYEMLKRVQHDNFVWFRWDKKLSGVYDSLVRVRRGK